MRWSNYTDVLTGQPLLAACLASYKKAKASAPASCAEGVPDCLQDLLAVTCIDMGLLASMDALQANPGWDGFWSRVQTEQAQCSSLTITEAQMQYIRQEAQTRGGGAGICPDPKPAAAQCSDGSSPNAAGGAAGPSAPQSGEGPSGALIGGIVGGAVVAVAVIGFMVLRCLTKPSRGGGRGDGNMPPPSRGGMTSSASSSSAGGYGGSSVAPQAAVAIPMQNSAFDVPVVQAQPVGKGGVPVAQARPLY